MSSGCVPMFPSPYLPQSLCSPVPIFPSPDVPRPGPRLYIPSSYIPQHLSFPTKCALCFPVSVFPSPFASQSLCSPVPLFPSLDIPHKWFPVPMFPKDIPQLYVPQSLCSPFPMIPWSVSGPYVPQRYSPVPMFHSPFRLDVPQCLCLGDIRNGKYFCGKGLGA